MHTRKSLKDRIQDAVAVSSLNSVSGDEGSWQSLDEKFAGVVAAADIQGVATLEEIAVDSESEEKYLFSEIVSDDEQSRLLDDLALDEESGSEWDYRSWLDRGVAHGKTVIAVKREGDRRYAGFAIVRTSVEMDAYDLEDGETPSVAMHVDLAAFYVSPVLRNLGYGKALSWCIGAYVDSVFGAVQEMPIKDRQMFDDLEFVVRLEGEAQSHAGARLLARVATDILTVMEMNAEHYGVPLPTMCDDIDYAEFGDEDDIDDDFRRNAVSASTPSP